MNYPKVSIIILNWNGWKDMIECLESLYLITYPNYDVIVVDNGSEDDSIEKIKEYAEGKMEVESRFFKYDPENKPINWIEYIREEAEAGGGKEKEIADLPSNKKLILIKNEKNYGFAEGNNIGMGYALKVLNPDYVLLLNNDTVVDKEFLGELVKVGEKDRKDRKVGIVGVKIFYYDEPDRVQSAGMKVNYKIPFLSKSLDREEFYRFDECSVDTVKGCSMLIKKEIMEEIGLLDKEYFAYGEEDDFCIRAKKAGYKTVYVPKAKIWHKIAGTTGGGFNPFVAYYKTRNMILLYRKNFPKIYFIVFIPYMCAFIVFHSLKALYEGKSDVILAMIKGVLWHFKH